MSDVPAGKPIDLRCTCFHHPRLAVFGVDPKTNVAWVHLKVWKGKNLYAEMISYDPTSVKVRCRSCLRWYRVKIVHGAPILSQDFEKES